MELLFDGVFVVVVGRHVGKNDVVVADGALLFFLRLVIMGGRQNRV